ncbi:vWA domain-containing protein [Chlorogloea sp. CCALA 695]|uniref:vWA domain-containing protein n=1 Tax=Chlorogloea sp. CCALA 695 TaxID=2107693 RepID=UPI000D070400|nr:VWA domain-containing protein [Chlorogloea sp. CCALA 695]PSB27089.1 glycosyl transferase family 2 [Chlorogloea sp. CCALA 695]
MPTNFYDDLIDNPTPRCPCMLVLDVSGSMDGEPIKELNEGVNQFIQAVMQDDFASYAVDIGIITFGGKAQEIVPIKSVQQVDVSTLSATGSTPMGEAVNKAIQVLEKRKQEYKNSGVSYYQPWLVLMSDGEPTDNYKVAATKLRQLAETRKMLVIAVGIGDSCNFSKLSEFCPSDNPPRQLTGLKFQEFFKWLSQSVGEVITKSTPGVSFQATQSTNGWESF